MLVDNKIGFDDFWLIVFEKCQLITSLGLVTLNNDFW